MISWRKHVTVDLALLVEVERLRAKMGGREDATPVALRTTSVFRNEGGAWKLMHRHADRSRPLARQTR